MSWQAAAASLSAQVPDARLCFAFASEEQGDLLSGLRVDLLYVFGPERHTGLLHWRDEASWFEGETFVVTRHGTPVARIVPNNDVEAGVRPARRPARFSVADLVHIDESIAEILTDLREDR